METLFIKGLKRSWESFIEKAIEYPEEEGNIYAVDLKDGSTLYLSYQKEKLDYLITLQVRGDSSDLSLSWASEIKTLRIYKEKNQLFVLFSLFDESMRLYRVERRVFKYKKQIKDSNAS